MRGDNSEAPSLQVKTEFSKAIYSLSSESLGRIVHILHTSCDKALNQISPDEMEILVDEIDTETFWEVSYSMTPFDVPSFPWRNYKISP